MSKCFIRALLVFAWCISMSTCSASENFFWIVEHGDLYQVSIDSLTSQKVGHTGLNDVSYGDLSYDEQSGQLYGLLHDGFLDSQTKLVTLDRMTGQATEIADVFSAGESGWGLDISPSGRAIAVSNVSTATHFVRGSFYEIDLNTGDTIKLIGVHPQLYGFPIASDSAGDLFTLGDLDTAPGQQPGIVGIDLATGQPIIPTENQQIIGGFGDHAFGYNPDDDFFYYTTEDGLVRLDPTTFQTSSVDFLSAIVPNGEHTGGFAPVPEPSLAILSLTMGFAFLSIRRRSMLPSK